MGSTENNFIEMNRSDHSSAGNDAEQEVEEQRGQPTQRGSDRRDRVHRMSERFAHVVERGELMGDDSTADEEHRSGSGDGQKAEQVRSEPQDGRA